MLIPFRGALLIAVLSATPFAVGWAKGFQAEPTVACDFLAAEGLRTRGGYLATGDVYRCRSQRRNLVGGGRVSNSIRFVAQGNADAVTQLRLELQVNSRSAIQRAHRQLADYSRSLMQAALGVALPEEVEAAILSAVNGSWVVAGSTVSLERVVSGAPLYELRFQIR
jgi:hypothetical protein